MKNIIPIIVFLFCVTVFGQRKIKYQLPDIALPAKDICGQKKRCLPGSNRYIAYTHHLVPYSPDIEDDSTIEDIALSILGHVVKKSEENSEELDFCGGNGEATIFNKNDITHSARYGVKGRKFNYNIKKINRTKIDLAIEANLESLINQNPSADIKYIDTLRLKLKSHYEKFKDKTLKVNARYYEWSLKQNVITRIKRAHSMLKCREYIKNKDLAIITDISIIKYDIKFNQTKVSELDPEFKVQLTKNGFINGKLGLLIEKEISKNFNSEVSKGFQVIGWRKMAIPTP